MTASGSSTVVASTDDPDRVGRPKHAPNNFDQLRLLAASAVFISHSAQLTRPTGGPRDPLDALTGAVSLGDLGLWAFFAMSGYLVAQSWRSWPSLAVFLRKRALRIFPGLAVMLVLSVVAGTALTTLGRAAYLTSTTTWSYLRNLALVPEQQGLPGVFAPNRGGSIFNGSLWTLRYEFLCYLLVPLLLSGRNLPRRTMALTVLLLAAGAAFPEGKTIGLGANLDLDLVLRMTGCFFVGVTLFLLRDRLRITGSVAVGVATLGVVGTALHFGQVPAIAATACVTIYLATGARPWPRVATRFGDFSYGVYIYGYPIEQAIIHIGGPGTSAWFVLLFGFPVALAFAAASWHFVEAPCLRLKPRRV